MAELTSILLYGQDALLLQTRQWVLEVAGYQVRRTTEFSEITLLPDPVDLLILCHSLLPEECGRACAFVSTRWPSIRCLVLPEGASACTEQMLCCVRDAIEKPVELIPTASPRLEIYRHQRLLPQLRNQGPNERPHI
jgi:hypothetical protein